MVRSKRSVTKRKESDSTDKLDERTDIWAVRMDTLGFKFAVGVSALAIVGLIAFFVFFFSSDARHVIAKSSIDRAYAKVQRQGCNGSTVCLDSSSDESTASKDKNYHVAILSDKVDKTEFIAYLSDMSDDDVIGLIDKVASNVSLGDTKIIGQTRKFFKALYLDEISTKAEIIDYLSDFKSLDFEFFIYEVVKALNPEQLPRLDKRVVSDTDDKLKWTIEQAYEEAERLYPGKVNVSKRLRLIADLNSSDYLYYVAERGDTLLKLSEAFQVSLGQLVELNGIQDADKIRAGEILLFPVSAKQPVITVN